MGDAYEQEIGYTDSQNIDVLNPNIFTEIKEFVNENNFNTEIIRNIINNIDFYAKPPHEISYDLLSNINFKNLDKNDQDVLSSVLSSKNIYNIKDKVRDDIMDTYSRITNDKYIKLLNEEMKDILTKQVFFYDVNNNNITNDNVFEPVVEVPVQDMPTLNNETTEQYITQSNLNLPDASQLGFYDKVDHISNICMDSMFDKNNPALKDVIKLDDLKTLRNNIYEGKVQFPTDNSMAMSVQALDNVITKCEKTNTDSNYDELAKITNKVVGRNYNCVGENYLNNDYDKITNNEKQFQKDLLKYENEKPRNGYIERMNQDFMDTLAKGDSPFANDALNPILTKNPFTNQIWKWDDQMMNLLNNAKMNSPDINYMPLNQIHEQRPEWLTGSNSRDAKCSICYKGPDANGNDTFLVTVPSSYTPRMKTEVFKENPAEQKPIPSIRFNQNCPKDYMLGNYKNMGIEEYTTLAIANYHNAAMTGIPYFAPPMREDYHKDMKEQIEKDPNFIERCAKNGMLMAQSKTIDYSKDKSVSNDVQKVIDKDVKKALGKNAKTPENFQNVIKDKGIDLLVKEYLDTEKSMDQKSPLLQYIQNASNKNGDPLDASNVKGRLEDMTKNQAFLIEVNKTYVKNIENTMTNQKKQNKGKSKTI